MDERVKELEKLLREARREFQWGGSEKARAFAARIDAALSGAPLREHKATDQEAPEARGPVGPPIDALSVDSRAAAAPEAGPLDDPPPTWRDKLCACGHRRGEHGGANEAGRCDHGCCYHDCNPAAPSPRPPEPPMMCCAVRDEFTCGLPLFHAGGHKDYHTADSPFTWIEETPTASPEGPPDPAPAAGLYSEEEWDKVRHGLHLCSPRCWCRIGKHLTVCADAPAPAAASAGLDTEAMIAAETELEAISDVVTGGRPVEDFIPATGVLHEVISRLGQLERCIRDALGVIEILTITMESGDAALAARAAYGIAKASKIEDLARAALGGAPLPEKQSESRAASAGEGALREALETVLEFARKWAESKRRDREALEEAEPILRAALAPAQREGKP